jgi:hypothetical protein
MARVRLTGDFGKVDAWGKRIAKFGSKETLRGISGGMADETHELISDGFDAERSPEGKIWAPRKIPESDPINFRRGRLRTSFKTKRMSANGFKVGSTVKHAKWAQEGRGPVFPKKKPALRFFAGGRWWSSKGVGPAPARPVVPVNASRPPPTWQLRLKQRAQRELNNRW